jgi:cyclophilin family peptidyl-prolyl cis-trans isomerase
MKKLITALLLISSATTIYAAEPIVTTAAPTAISTPSIVEMQTNVGTITIQLDWPKAPITSKNFIDYVNSGFYKNILFHRAIKNFMIQGGGVDSTTGQFKAPSPTIKSEADNGLSNTVGTVAMARTSDPNSATSQFFINTVNNLFLNKGYVNPDTTVNPNKTPSDGYTVFGKVISGLDVAIKIGNFPTQITGYAADGTPYIPSDCGIYLCMKKIFIENLYTSSVADINSITRVTVNGGGGKVTSLPAGINCTSTSKSCVLTQPQGANVRLISTPSKGYEMRGWSGDCQGFTTPLPLTTKITDETTKVTTPKNNNCTATFAKIGS